MSEPLVTRSAADRNLLFGILALQLDFLDRDALIAGMNAWLLDKDKSLGHVLSERGALTAERRALLDSLVEEHVRQHGNDPRRSLEAVAAHSTVTDCFEAVADRDVQSTLTELAPVAGRWNGSAGPPPGRNDIRYRRLRAHARGGLGQVFVAEDMELHREVAVKEIQPERADDPGSRNRFLLEAEITGALEHPGIIPVYGLGAYPNGRPYYAMRFVRGVSLKTAIEQFHGQDWSGRSADRLRGLRPLLRRLIDTCNAVAYAHSRGVLHRDLKPQNVMLGKYAETLVLDWGLAKVGIDPLKRDPDNDVTTDPIVRPSSGSEHAGTQAGSALGTPGYMSPEQAAGRHDELTPSSDVYSLGVILHVILTGRKPTDASSTVPSSDADEPVHSAPPGNRSVPAALLAASRKAMASEPSDRYQTPLAFAAELERWLADEPVMVYRDSWPVRAARWGRRHRPAVAAGLVLLVTTLVASIVGTGLLWREERRTAEQKREAEENYQLARQMSSGIELIASSEAELAADPTKHTARKEVLVGAAKAFRKHLDRYSADPEVRRQAARVFRYAANVHRLEREYVAAGTLYRDAVELLEALAAEHADDPTYRLQLCETLRDHAKVQSMRGRLDDATKALNRVIEIADSLLAEEPANPNYRRARAAALLARSGAQYARGEFAHAGTDAALAADLFRDLSTAPEGKHPYDPILQAIALNLIAIAERESGRPEKSLPIHREAIKLIDPLVKERREGVNRVEAEHVQTYFRLEQSRTWVLTGSRPNAEKNFGLTAQVWQQMAKDHPKVPDYHEMSGVAYYERGKMRAQDNRQDEAAADFEKSREILEAEVRRSPDVPALSADLGRTYAGLARLARDRGDRAAAADWFAKAIAALKSCVDRGPDRARDRRDLQDVEAEVGR
jgi:serine/threonine protein kinase/tetratricopeptide (TPR) repeat protein